MEAEEAKFRHTPLRSRNESGQIIKEAGMQSFNDIVRDTGNRLLSFSTLSIFNFQLLPIL